MWCSRAIPLARQRFRPAHKRPSPGVIIHSSEKRHERFLPLLTITAALAVATIDRRDDRWLGDSWRRLQTVQLDAAAADGDVDDDDEATVTVLNWSGTHDVKVANEHFWEPETVEEVEKIVKDCHEKGQPVRPLGSALSPNAIAFQEAGMMGLINLNQVLEVDKERNTVTVQAGARVSEVIDALRPYGLTLPNLSSIAEQQMGGLVQVGAHGTGRCIAPLDHYVTRLKMVTPAKGTIVLTEADGDLFHLAKVGLGCLGVVVEITMKCIPSHKLVEHTFVLTREEAVNRRDELLKEHKHMRYMWIPHTDAVVVVTNDPKDEVSSIPSSSNISNEERMRPLTSLLLDLSKDTDSPYTKETLKGMGFGELRDALLAINPLDVDHVKKCNKAEAEFWRQNEGFQVKPSDELLQFDCGGQQWVWEACFPTGTQEDNNNNDMIFMRRLLAGIEERGVAAHAPIEQRWSSSSSSLMSPAHGSSQGLHCWVGIINYLPSEDVAQRQAITNFFKEDYCDLMRSVGKEVNATSHWAKLERPTSWWNLIKMKYLLASRYPLQKFNQTRALFDPKNILGSPLLDAVLGTPESK